jgi:pSer/pThr/pTyr-binding forkhead associated (FHA) protein
MVITLECLDEAGEKGVVVETPDLSDGEREFIIGRDRHCHLQLPSDYVSRRHCELIVNEREQALRLRDLGSRNGTFVNDKVVAGEIELKDGDKLTVGCIPFEVHIG